MEILFTIFFLIFGLIFGSFYNVVGLRVPIHESFTEGRSMCPGCKHSLSWYELIPVFSYIFLLGKCKRCGEKISILYPITELATGFLFVLSYHTFGLSIELMISLLLCSMLVIVLVTDIKYMLIPNKVLLFFLPIFIILRIIEPLTPWWSSIGGAFIGTSIIAIIILVSRGGMGAGDMKLFGVLGIVLGVKHVLLAFFLSCIIGSVVGVLMLLLKVIKRKQPVPFGPYIVIATVITYFYGDQLINWYFNIL